MICECHDSVFYTNVETQCELIGLDWTDFGSGTGWTGWTVWCGANWTVLQQEQEEVQEHKMKNIQTLQEELWLRSTCTCHRLTDTSVEVKEALTHSEHFNYTQVFIVSYYFTLFSCIVSFYCCII